MTVKTLTWYVEHPDYFMLTAHRGASFEFPENTLLAMEKAVNAGADMIEFDIIGTADGVPVILHDGDIDRTSNGTGSPWDMSLAELRRLNFSYYLQGQRRSAPAYDNVTIPTFQEILERFHDKVNMNIQLHDSFRNEDVLTKICDLFCAYSMFDHAYLTVIPELADKIMTSYPQIELCVTPSFSDRCKPEALKMCSEKYHCRFVQPADGHGVTEESLRLMTQLGLRGNVFYSDTAEDTERLIAMGAQGILTNCIHQQIALRTARG